MFRPFFTTQWPLWNSGFFGSDLAPLAETLQFIAFQVDHDMTWHVKDYFNWKLRKLKNSGKFFQIAFAIDNLPSVDEDAATGVEDSKRKSGESIPKLEF